MSKIYLAEGLTGAFPFIVDRSKPFVTESKAGGGTITRIPGRLSVCDCVNGNNRRYGKRIWEKNLEEGSVLTESIKRYAAFGLLEHPKDGIVTLESPISHQVTKAELKEATDQAGKKVYEVHGEISLYDFGDIYIPESRKLRALIEGGYNPLVSSRGYGSLKKASDGVDDVDEDYVCEGWDVVIKPSFTNAELTPERGAVQSHAESQPAKPAERALSESQPTLRESPSSGAAPAVASVTKPKLQVMNINEIKSRITVLRGTDIKAGPQRFAESMADAESLHQEVAKYAAEDPTNSYNAHKLHKELDDLATKWQESVNAPVKQAIKLTESNNKLMKVISSVAKVGLTYKNKLGEALKTIAEQKKVISDLVSRGRGWMQIAESRKEKFAKLESQFQTSCEALDMMAARYHADTVDMGRRILTLEFKDKAQTPEIQKLLKEATRLRNIAAIREQLEGKKPGAPVQEGTPAAGAPAAPAAGTPAAAAPAAEGTPAAGTPAAAPAAAAPVAESISAKPADAPKPVTEGRVLMNLPGDPRGLNESVALVQRLSATNSRQ